MQLIRHEVDQCETLTDCFSCVNSGDPICGWCALSGVCSRGRDCGTRMDGAGVPQRVFAVTNSACPTIERSTPPVIYLQQLQVSSFPSQIPSPLLIMFDMFV